MDTKELLLTSCRHTQQWSACLWDYSSGNILHYYKNGGIVAPKSLNLLGNDYIVTCDDDKPVTHVWPINSQEPTKKFTTIFPEKATVLTISPRSCYIAAGIGVKLYIWHISSGKLFSVQKRNFQPISCIKFSNDGNYVIVTGQDGMLIVYDLISLVSFHNNYVSQSDIGQVEPLFSRHDHSMPIVDLHVGSFERKARIATVSTDHTCKIYTLATKQLLLSLVFNEPLTSVIFDGPCWNLFVGTNSGKIHQFYLREPPRVLEHHVDDQCIFQGHKKRINCLDLSVTFKILVSGSEDNFVHVWDISSRQIIKSIEHKASVTNVKFVMNHENFFVQNLKPKVIVKTLEKDLNQSDVYIDTKIQDYDIELSDDEDSPSQVSANSDLELENARLKSINKQLYDAAMQISRKYNQF